MKRILLFAPLGGIVGSVTGAMILAGLAFIGATTRQGAVVGAIQAGFGYPIFTMPFTVPACLIIGSPVIYAFREPLVRNPLPWAALVAVLGIFLGAACLGWAFTSTTNSQGFALLCLFSSTTAFSYAFLYGWRTRRRLRLARS
jgi:hypothetical protein